MTRESLSILALLLLFASLGACREEEPASDVVDRAAWVADTQIMRDSLGREFEIIIGHRGDAIEVEPRAGSGDPDAPNAVGGLDPRRADVLMRSATPRWFLIDVRNSEQYARQGWIEGAFLMELPLLESNIEDLHVRTVQPILVYDDDGSRGAEAARLLSSYGYPVVRYVEGGFQAWKAEGLPIASYP